MRSVAIIGLALALVACGGTQSASNSPAASASPSAQASPSTGSGTLSGGYGDTANNPGQTYACEFKGLLAADMSTVIDYVTITGNSASLCPLFQSQTNYQSETGLTIPTGAPVC